MSKCEQGSTIIDLIIALREALDTSEPEHLIAFTQDTASCLEQLISAAFVAIGSGDPEEAREAVFEFTQTYIPLDNLRIITKAVLPLSPPTVH